ncbi:putative iq calmodulin-binding motif protein [Diplodia seriata]|uniref:Putative iq calmodulin-binding motif protein n=1 Tax=Diplodia seriata TaxID=420778 RepID=A0A0G2EQ12_9PEZI|nr:putative iq calmodulin-binding motif protein [Diplodia seriata]
MSNLIARAEHEVILATNYWKESDASRLITDSLKELSKRAGRRNQRAVVKIIYDRGSAKQVFNNHLDVGEAERTAKGVGIPSANEIPNIDIEVINYHRPVLGTFHAKFMVVDRKIGIVCSNNIQVSRFAVCAL